jgi:hypothetical protein
MNARLSAVAIVLAIGGLTQLVAAAKEKPPAAEKIAEKHPGPLPDEVIKDWKRVGADVGWIGRDRFKFEEHRPADGKEGELPAFRFRQSRAGVVGQLRNPASAFGVDLADAKITDAELKEIAGLSNLQVLFLGDAKVTDNGLDELARLKDIQTLIVGDTQATCAGLAELQKKLPRCEFLH